MKTKSKTTTDTTRAVVRIQGKAVQVGRNTTWRGLVASFVAEQDVRESSRALYARTLTQFFKWVEETGRRYGELSRTDILEYKDGLIGRGLSPLSVGSYIVAVRKFYEWAEAGMRFPNIAKGIKTPKRAQAFKKQHLSDGSSREMLRHFEEGASLRDYAIVNLMLRTGLRTIEVARADIGDITFKGERRVLKIWGKGRDDKSDFVVLSEKAYEPIARYLSEGRRAYRSGEPLFTSESRQNFGGRLTTRTISGICKEGLRSIGLDGREYTAHSLRHTAAVAILRQSGDITAVQAVLRHSTPATSQIYTESIREELRLEKAPEMMIDNVF